MLVPLGVLAVGAVLAGMIWYKPFFGDHDRLVSFFGLPHHAEASESGEHAAPAAEHAEAPAGEHAAPVVEQAAPATEHAAAEGAAPAGDAHATAPGWEKGALFMAPTNTVLDDAHHSPAWVKMSPFFAMLIGLGLAYWFYIVDPTRPKALAASQPVLYRFLLNKWYFDEIYDLVFVRTARWLGVFLWKQGDGKTIDGTINSVAMGFVPFMTRLAGRAQSGYLFHYAFAMVLGILVLTLWVGISAGH